MGSQESVAVGAGGPPYLSYDPILCWLRPLAMVEPLAPPSK